MEKENKMNKTKLVGLFMVAIMIGVVFASLSASACSVLKPGEESPIKSKTSIANGVIYIGEEKEELLTVIYVSDEITGRISFEMSHQSSSDVTDECGEEPDCNPSAQGEGIQECMRAADCRFEKCIWANCVLYYSGEISWLEYIGGGMACAAVHIAELLACIPDVVIPDGAAKSSTVQPDPAIETEGTSI